MKPKSSFTTKKYNLNFGFDCLEKTITTRFFKSKQLQTSSRFGHSWFSAVTVNNPSLVFMAESATNEAKSEVML